MKTQPVEFEPKKWPSQERSRRTFGAIVEACARLLREHGYGAVTTNHIAETAGVGIASLYEYFPGKDAIVAQVGAALVEQVMARLQMAMGETLAGPQENAVQYWIDQIYFILKDESALVAVFVYQVPFTQQLPFQRNMMPMLMQFSRTAAQQAGVTLQESTADFYLLINLVTSTILQLILRPPEEVEITAMLGALGRRVERWITD